MSTQSIPPNTTIVMQSPYKLQKFDGINKGIRVQTWLKLFAVHTQSMSDSKRIKALLYNLKGSALEWYGDEIAEQPQISWDQVKDSMCKRFGVSTAQPLIAAQKLIKQSNQTLEEYYRQKIRLLNQTNLSASEKAQMLTEGLPYIWKCSLAPIIINSTDNWF